MLPFYLKRLLRPLRRQARRLPPCNNGFHHRARGLPAAFVTQHGISI